MSEDKDEAIYRMLEAARSAVPPDQRHAGRIVNVPMTLDHIDELMSILAGLNPELAPRCDCPRDRVLEAVAEEGCGSAQCPYRFGI